MFEVPAFSFFAFAAARAANAAVVATVVVTAVAGASQPPPPWLSSAALDPPLLALAAAAPTSEQRSSHDLPLCMLLPPRLPPPLPLVDALLLGGVDVVATGVAGFTGNFTGDVTAGAGVIDAAGEGMSILDWDFIALFVVAVVAEESERC